MTAQPPPTGTIADIADFEGGTQPPRSTFSFSPSEDRVRLIQIRDYKSNEFKTYIPKALARNTCTADDIMIGRYGPPVFQILRGLEGSFNVALIKVHPKKGIEREFLYQVLKQKSLFDLIDGLSQRSSGQTGVDMSALRSFPIFLPELKEQEATAEALSDADALIEGLERLIAKKRLIKQGAMQDLLTAKRRLPGFSGEWERYKLGERGQFFKGSGVRKDEANSGFIPCVRYGELYTIHDDVVREFASYISPEVAKTARPILNGDILFAGSGETKEEIGKCAVVTHDGEMYAGGDIIVFRPRADDPVFLAHLLNAPKAQKQKARKGQGDAVVHISATAVGDIDVQLPDTEEQRRISGVLEDMDAEIQALESRLEKARQVKEGMMQNLLTGRIRLV